MVIMIMLGTSEIFWTEQIFEDGKLIFGMSVARGNEEVVKK